MSTTYEITGFPAIAVRLGGALQQWGRRAAQPPTHEELFQRREQLSEAQRARAARDAALHGLYRLL